MSAAISLYRISLLNAFDGSASAPADSAASGAVVSAAALDSAKSGWGATGCAGRSTLAQAVNQADTVTMRRRFFKGESWHVGQLLTMSDFTPKPRARYAARP